MPDWTAYRIRPVCLPRHNWIKRSIDKGVDNLAQSAQGFRRGANRVRKQMWWKDMKMRMCIALGIIILLVIIIVPVGMWYQSAGITGLPIMPRISEADYKYSRQNHLIPRSLFNRSIGDIW